MTAEMSSNEAYKLFLHSLNIMIPLGLGFCLRRGGGKGDGAASDAEMNPKEIGGFHNKHQQRACVNLCVCVSKFVCACVLYVVVDPCQR